MEKRSDYIEQELESMRDIARRDENQLEEYMLNTLLKSATSSKVKKNAEEYFDRRKDKNGNIPEFPNVGISKPNFPSKIRAVLTNLMGLFKVAVNIHLELILGKKTYYIEEIEDGGTIFKRIISQEEYVVFEKYFKAQQKDIKNYFVKLSIIQIKSIKSQIEAAIVHSFPTIVSKLSKLLFSAESNLSTSLNDIVLYRYEDGFMRMALDSINSGSHGISDSVFENREIVEKYFATYVLSGKITKEGFPSISRLKATKSHKFAGILKHALKGILSILDSDVSTEEEFLSAKNAIEHIKEMTTRPEGNTTYITYSSDEIYENLISDNINEVYDDIIQNYCSIGESKQLYSEKLFFYICCYRAINALKVRKFEQEQLGSNIFGFVSLGGVRVSDFFNNKAFPEGSTTFSALAGSLFDQTLDLLRSSEYASSKAVSAVVKIIGSKTKNSVRKTLPKNFEQYILERKMPKIVETCLKDYEQIGKVIKKKNLKNADVILKEYNSRFSFIPSDDAIREFDFDGKFVTVLRDSYIERLPSGYAQKYALTMNTLFKVPKEAPLKQLDDNALDIVEAINILSFAANLNSLVTGDLQSFGSPNTQQVTSPTTQQVTSQLTQEVYDVNDLQAGSVPASPVGQRGRTLQSPPRSGERGRSPRSGERGLSPRSGDRGLSPRKETYSEDRSRGRSPVGERNATEDTENQSNISPSRSPVRGGPLRSRN